MGDRRPLTIVFFVLSLMVVGSVAVVLAIRQPQHPTSFAQSVSAYGFVEEVNSRRGGCEVRVAVYSWSSLSLGFPPLEVPEQNDRYQLRGTAENCAALTVVSTSVDGHIAFEAGKAGDRWYFVENPVAGTGCGGLKMTWVPGAVKRVFG